MISFRDGQRLSGPALGFGEGGGSSLGLRQPAAAVQGGEPRGALGLGQDQVAVFETRCAVEQIRLGLLLLHLGLGSLFSLSGLGLLEDAAFFVPLPALAQGIGGGGASAHEPKRIATAVGKCNGPAGIGHGLPDAPSSHFQMAEVAGSST